MILKNQIIYSKPFVKVSITTGLAVRDISPCFVLQ